MHSTGREPGVQALDGTGQRTLRPIALQGAGGFEINAVATDGAVRFEVLNARGFRVRGFTTDDASPFQGDSLLRFESTSRVM